jgi:hypothetical protein
MSAPIAPSWKQEQPKAADAVETLPVEQAAVEPAAVEQAAVEQTTAEQPQADAGTDTPKESSE